MILSLFRKNIFFHLINMKTLSKGLFFPSLTEIRSEVLEEKMRTWKVFQKITNRVYYENSLEPLAYKVELSFWMLNCIQKLLDNTFLINMTPVTLIFATGDMKCVFFKVPTVQSFSFLNFILNLQNLIQILLVITNWRRGSWLYNFKKYLTEGILKTAAAFINLLIWYWKGIFLIQPIVFSLILFIFLFYLI